MPPFDPVRDLDDSQRISSPSRRSGPEDSAPHRGEDVDQFNSNGLNRHTAGRGSTSSNVRTTTTAQDGNRGAAPNDSYIHHAKSGSTSSLNDSIYRASSIPRSSPRYNMDNNTSKPASGSSEEYERRRSSNPPYLHPPPVARQSLPDESSAYTSRTSDRISEEPSHPQSQSQNGAARSGRGPSPTAPSYPPYSWQHPEEHRRHSVAHLTDNRHYHNPSHSPGLPYTQEHAYQHPRHPSYGGHPHEAHPPPPGEGRQHLAQWQAPNRGYQAHYVVEPAHLASPSASFLPPKVIGDATPSPSLPGGISMPGGSLDSFIGKRHRISRACDNCRRKKVRCDAPALIQPHSDMGHDSSEVGDRDGYEGNHLEDVAISGPCGNCRKAGTRCVFSKMPMKRGPNRGYIQQLEERITTLESSITEGSAAVTSPERPAKRLRVEGERGTPEGEAMQEFGMDRDGNVNGHGSGSSKKADERRSSDGQVILSNYAALEQHQQRQAPTSPRPSSAKPSYDLSGPAPPSSGILLSRPFENPRRMSTPAKLESISQRGGVPGRQLDRDYGYDSPQPMDGVEHAVSNPMRPSPPRGDPTFAHRAVDGVDSFQTFSNPSSRFSSGTPTGPWNNHRHSDPIPYPSSKGSLQQSAEVHRQYDSAPADQPRRTSRPEFHTTESAAQFTRTPSVQDHRASQQHPSLQQPTDRDAEASLCRAFFTSPYQDSFRVLPISIQSQGFRNQTLFEAADLLIPAWPKTGQDWRQALAQITGKAFVGLMERMDPTGDVDALFLLYLDALRHAEPMRDLLLVASSKVGQLVDGPERQRRETVLLMLDILHSTAFGVPRIASHHPLSVYDVSRMSKCLQDANQLPRTQEGEAFDLPVVRMCAGLAQVLRMGESEGWSNVQDHDVRVALECSRLAIMLGTGQSYRDTDAFGDGILRRWRGFVLLYTCMQKLPDAADAGRSHLQMIEDIFREDETGPSRGSEPDYVPSCLGPAICSLTTLALTWASFVCMTLEENPAPGSPTSIPIAKLRESFRTRLASIAQPAKDIVSQHIASGMVLLYERIASFAQDAQKQIYELPSADTASGKPHGLVRNASGSPKNPDPRGFPAVANRVRDGFKNRGYLGYVLDRTSPIR